MAKKRRTTFNQRSRAKSSAEKAAYHDVSGAGRSKVRRPFFSLTESDEEVLSERYRQFLDRTTQSSR